MTCNSTTLIRYAIPFIALGLFAQAPLWVRSAYVPTRSVPDLPMLSEEWLVPNQGCGTLKCDADAGSLVPTLPMVCFLDDTVNISAAWIDPVVPPGFQAIFILTTGVDQVIAQGAFTPAFNVFSMDVYTMRTLVYDPNTLDLSGLTFGASTVMDLNAMLIQGGGMACGSVDLIGAPISVLDCTPVNDHFANALGVTISSASGCGQNMVFGNNANATSETGNDPSCYPGSTSFADVWYSFNSGPNTQISIVLDPGTMQNWGLTVTEGSAGGVELACADGPAVPIDVTTLPETDHWVRVFSDLGTGPGGAFGLCVMGALPSPVCSGGEVAGNEEMTTMDVCRNTEADVVNFSTTSAAVENYAYIITNEQDSIEVLVTEASFDFNTLPLGTYRSWGISYHGVLQNVAPGNLLSDVNSTSGCFEWSSNSVVVNVELCSGIQVERAGRSSIFPNPAEGDFSIRYEGVGALVDIDIIGIDGRVMLRQRTALLPGVVYTMNMDNRLSPGTYFVRLTTIHEVEELRLMMH